MMKSNKAGFQWVLNGFCLVAVFFALHRIIGSNSETASQNLQRSSTVALAGVEWSSNGRTLIMAVRPGCHWCTASAAFYRDILRSNSANGLHVLAISPEAVHDTQEYLHQLGVDIEDVRQSAFDNLGVAGTPTLILVNGKGRIESTWIGKLSPEREGEVFKALRIDRVRSNDQPIAKQQ